MCSKSDKGGKTGKEKKFESTIRPKSVVLLDSYFSYCSLFLKGIHSLMRECREICFSMNGQEDMESLKD